MSEDNIEILAFESVGNDRVCRICGVAKPNGDFYRDKGMVDGIRNECKQCSNKTRKNRKPKTALETQVAGAHYKKFNIQPYEFFIKNAIPKAEGDIIQYVLRHREKNGIEDLKKAAHCIKLLAEIEYGKHLD